MKLDYKGNEACYHGALIATFAHFVIAKPLCLGHLSPISAENSLSFFEALFYLKLNSNRVREFS